MNKNKWLIVSILFTVLLVVGVSAGTYAYIAAATNSGEVNTGSGMLGIDYTAPSPITGNLYPSSIRDSGLSTTTNASLTSGSQKAYLNMYIVPTSITNLNIEALRWEAEGLRDTNNDGILDVVCSKSGNFKNATINTPIKVIDACELTTSATKFDIYIWLDASKITTSISNANFGAKITADSVNISGGF